MLRARISSGINSFMYGPIPRRLTRQGRTEALYTNHIMLNAYRVTSIGKVYNVSSRLTPVVSTKKQESKAAYQKRLGYLRRF